jgi:hypothetical protein
MKYLDPRLTLVLLFYDFLFFSFYYSTKYIKDAIVQNKAASRSFYITDVNIMVTENTSV